MASYNPLLQDVESGGKFEASYAFAEQTVRQGFVRRVFGLLAAQLLLTVGVAAAFLYHAPTKQYVYQNPWTLWTAMGVSLVIVLVLAFWEDARRSHPLNLVMLFAFTACEAVLVGAVSATYDTQVVLVAAAITTGVVIGLVLFTLQTKIDLTATSGILFSFLFTLILASLLQVFIRATLLQWAITAGGALLFSCYLVLDIQLLMGSGAVALSPDEYVTAALNLYLDVINLFLYILRMVAELSRDN